MEPIATYTEKRLFSSRRFELYEDKIVVHSWVPLGTEQRQPLELRALSPEPGLYRGRIIQTNFGALLFLIAAVGYLGSLLAFEVEPVGWAGVGLICVALVGLAMAFHGLRRLEYVTFRNDVGMETLWIGRYGPDRDSLDSFVELLVERIRLAKQGEQSDGAGRRAAEAQTRAASEGREPRP